MDFSYSDATVQTTSSLPAVLVFLVLSVLVMSIIAFILYSIRTRRQHGIQSARMQRGIVVILPKQANDQDEDRRDPKELTALMEPIFGSIQHFVETNRWRAFWFGQPTFTFEIVARNGEIFFYVTAPSHHLPTLERQIHAQYPAAHIEEDIQFDLFLEEGGESSVAALTYMKPEIFPIRSFRSMENDPLNTITSSLSKIGHARAALQIVVRPTLKHWQKDIETALQNVQQGKDFSRGKSSTLAKAGKLAGELGKAAIASTPDQTEQNEAHNVSSGNVRLTALQEEQSKRLVEKGSKPALETQIRVVSIAETKAQAEQITQTLLSSFSIFQAPEANALRITSRERRGVLVDYVLRTISRHQPSIIMGTDELTSLFHFPNRHLDTPNIHWLSSRRLAPPINLPESGTSLGYSSFRGIDRPVYIKPNDRMRHLYAIGQTGVGKTNLFQNMILQDIRDGAGVCYMDPNGDAVEWILRHIPKERAEDVIYFNPADAARPMGLNLLEFDPNYPEQKTMVINEVISIFDKLYDLKATGGPIFEQYMRNACLLIMDDVDSGSTLMEIPRVLSDPDFRKLKLSRCKNQTVIDFWVKEAEKAGGEAALANIVPYITSKLTQFTSSDVMRPIIGQQNSAFNFRKLMDEGKILLVALPKGLLGDMSAMLLGMIISGKIQIAAFSRQNQPESERRPFYLYVDEFQNFTSKTFATILSEARKYALSLNITHQYIDQLDEETRNAVFGNVGTIVNWRIGAKDSEFMTKIMDPLKEDDLINVEKYTYYLRLMIDSAPNRPFNVHTYPPDPHENVQIGEAIRQLSRLKFGRDKQVIEAEIRMRSNL